MVYVVNAFTLGMLPEVERGVLEFRVVDLEKVKEILSRGGWTSAVGHQSTAEILTELTGVQVPFNRLEVKINPGDVCVVFQLLRRPPEGVVLTREEILKIPYKFYLVRLK